MEIKDVFNTPKKPFNLKLDGYTFLGVHSDFNVVYFLRKFDGYNFDFATMKISEEFGLFNIPKYTFLAGSDIKIVDTFMMEYLRHRKEMLEGTPVENFHEIVLETFNLDEEELKKVKGMFGVEIPEVLSDYSILKDDFKILYVRDNKSVIKHSGRTIDVILYKEATAGKTDNYVIFKSLEFVKRKNDNEKDFHFSETPQIIIPTFLLK